MMTHLMANDRSDVELADERQPVPRALRALVVAEVVLVWCWSWLPQMVDLNEIGRQNPGLGQVAQRSALAAEVYTVVMTAILCVALAIVYWAVILRHRVYLGRLVVLLLPWVALNGIYVAEGGTKNEVLALPVVLAAFALTAGCLPTVYVVLRQLVLVTAVSSLVLGIWQPDMFLSDPTQELGNEKAIVGHLLLNGLFPTSNQLGVALALGLPLLVLGGSRITKVVGIPAVLAAMIWAASRTSLAAVGITLLVLMVARPGRAGSKAVFKGAAVAGGLLVVFVPFVFTNPDEFTGRGAIWQASYAHVFDGFHHLLLGNGAMTYQVPSPVTLAVGAITNTGHNAFVTTLTVGGLVAAAALVLLWMFYFGRAAAAYRSDPLPLIFLLTLTMVSVLEDPFRAFIVDPSGFIVLPLLAMPMAVVVAVRGDGKRP